MNVKSLINVCAPPGGGLCPTPEVLPVDVDPLLGAVVEIAGLGAEPEDPRRELVGARVATARARGRSRVLDAGAARVIDLELARGARLVTGGQFGRHRAELRARQVEQPAEVRHVGDGGTGRRQERRHQSQHDRRTCPATRVPT
ncbi:hypothetical protein [Nonomuraea salmonea]|uniref:hypothetical protein n=1 Tax=Nonomuraea salmonea TaxID=46181 RepID=UPI0031ECAC8F